MNRCIILLITLFSVFTGCSNTDKPSSSSTPSLSGTWIVVAYNGVRVRTDVEEYRTVWQFEGNQVKTSTSVVRPPLTGTYTYNEATTPKQLDLHIDRARTNPNYAIYKFTDSSLVVKVMLDAEKIATDFTVENGYELLEFIKD
jgi:uncharacterized protein (TIGR03067 family)